MTTQSTKKVHPGRILLEEFLAPRGVSVWHLAKDIGVPVRRTGILVLVVHERGDALARQRIGHADRGLAGRSSQQVALINRQRLPCHLRRREVFVHGLLALAAHFFAQCMIGEHLLKAGC